MAECPVINYRLGFLTARDEDKAGSFAHNNQELRQKKNRVQYSISNKTRKYDTIKQVIMRRTEEK